MKEIKDAQKKWKVAKDAAQAQCEKSYQYDTADILASGSRVSHDL